MEEEYDMHVQGGVKKPSKVVAIGCWVQLHLTTHVVFKWRTEVSHLILLAFLQPVGRRLVDSVTASYGG